MSSVTDYRKWLSRLLKESEAYPDNAEVIVTDDSGNIIMEGLGGSLIVEEIMEVSFNGDDVEIVVVTDY